MIQVQTMADSELNLALALLCGHREISDREDVENQRQRNDHAGSGVVVLYGNHYIVRANGKYGTWAPCTDPAASLEVQTAAIAKDPEKYIRNMSIVQCGPDPKVHEMVGVDLKGAARIADAKPRERAEAAYITLSSKQ
ncbi:hypothetical protein MKY64_30370 [Paenibacillus sp. FSL R7-0210]|uniref:hypothetical protein n=1 Tax=Paenibacillus sp. FSL R7-0210 TaxID=2921676 RepID=UPI0030F609B2